MKLRNDGASVFVPDGVREDAALERTTHVGIGAHADDLEIMAYHGIGRCYRDPERWFAGVICTDGAGSSRTGPLADTSDDEMRAVRRLEQERAATIGEYGLMVQLDYSSAVVNGPDQTGLHGDLTDLLRAMRPRVVYAHSPADKHDTHVGVFFATIAALRDLDPAERPETVYGCEGWRSLDWMDDADKITLDVSAHPELARELVGVFESQIAGGKRYDLATVGRRAANATFEQPRSADRCDAVWLAVDLSPLVQDDSLDILDYVDGLVQRFARDVHDRLSGRLRGPGTTG